jgi:hypothetical protein
MHIVPEEDIKMFARGLIGRQGPLAFGYAQSQSKRLATLKDQDGAVVWNRVAEAVAARMRERGPAA